MWLVMPALVMVFGLAIPIAIAYSSQIDHPKAVLTIDAEISLTSYLAGGDAVFSLRDPVTRASGNTHYGTLTVPASSDLARALMAKAGRNVEIVIK